MSSSATSAGTDFSIAVLAPDSVVDCTPGSLAYAYLRMRALIYIDQRAILDQSHRRLDGTELDVDDRRATHLVATDRYGAVGCLRLIVKAAQEDRPLPIEQAFPHSFHQPLGCGAVEVSRLIVDPGGHRPRQAVKIGLIKLALACIVRRDLGPVFAVLEAPLLQDLRALGVPMSLVAGPEHIVAYRSVNMGVAIDHEAFQLRLGPGALDNLKAQYGAINPFGHIQS